MRQFFRKINSNEKLKELVQKYNIPIDYLSPNRKMISKGAFIGIFIAFIPMPMQMLAVVSIMPFTRFNVPLALAICWLSNPFTMPFMYYMEYLTGTFLLGIETLEVDMSIEWFGTNLDNIFIPLYVGTAFYSVIGSVFAYFLINYLWRESVKKDIEIRKNTNGKNGY